MVDRTRAEFGTIDILVNNAGIQYVAPIEEFPVDVHADRYFGRYRGKNGHAASKREPTRLTQVRRLHGSSTRR